MHVACGECARTMYLPSSPKTSATRDSEAFAMIATHTAADNLKDKNEPSKWDHLPYPTIFPTAYTPGSSAWASDRIELASLGCWPRGESLAPSDAAHKA